MGQTKTIIASYVGILVYASLVFVGAWRIVYWQGLLYVALALVGATLSHVLVPAGSTLTVDRARDVGAGQSWDKQLLGVGALVSAATFVIAGLDSGRFGWSGDVPRAVTVAGAVLMLVGQGLFAVAKRENRFFSSTVRIQSERGHEVCDTGVDRRVRHPGYLGLLLSLIAFPMVMGSYWALIPTALGAALLIARTVLEDRFLLKELAGYSDYAAKTRWRLLPGVL